MGFISSFKYQEKQTWVLGEAAGAAAAKIFTQIPGNKWCRE